MIKRFLFAGLAALRSLAEEPSSPDRETLRYSVSWPSGLTLGEAEWTARRGADRQEFSFSFEAAVPGYRLMDTYRSAANAQGCSLELEKVTQRGSRRGEEKTTFDLQDGKATRVTKGGGSSALTPGPCAKDALTFLALLRRDVAQGRLPAPQGVLLGAIYRVTVEYMRVENVTVGGSSQAADRLAVKVTGPASELKGDLFLARDAARTPLLVRVPLAVGTFSVELQP